MVKAAAGGGGRGMRLVQTDDELLQAIELARSEAERAFGNSDLIIESAIKRDMSKCRFLRTLMAMSSIWESETVLCNDAIKR